MDCYNSNSLYHVFGRVIRSHFQRMHAVLEGIGLYPGQHPLLFILGHRDGQSQKELAEKLKIKPATITVMINRMEKAGFLERRHDSEDQRVSRIYLTEKGKRTFTLVKEKLKSISDECFRDMTEEEKVILRRLLLQVSENLEKANQENMD